jgi:hypothetical protein
MGNPWADANERVPRTPACFRGVHDDCPHLMSGFGGGFNPRRLRLEFGGLLCKCDCHSSCPVTSERISVSIRAWRESCACPGAEAERVRHDQAGIGSPDFDFDFDEEWARSRQRSRSRREAFQAARAGAAGKTREEVIALYIAELRSRGLKIPEGKALDANVDALTGNYVTGVRLMGRLASDLWKLLRSPR